MRALLSLVVLSVGCVGAGGGQGDSSSLGSEPWVEIGAGASRFEVLAEGDPIDLVHGPQGGWHVDVALRFGGFGPEGVQLSYRAFDPQSHALLSYPLDTELVSTQQVLEVEGGWERLGDRVVFDISSPDEVADREIELWVSASRAGSSWEDARVVRVLDLGP